MKRDSGRQSDAMLAAYVDGADELSTAEREAIEARLRDDGELRAEELETRDAIAALRELGATDREAAGSTLDWAAMEHAIRDAVGPDVPRPWWRRWRWLVPGMATLAVATAVLVVVVRTSSSAELGDLPAVHDAAVAQRDPAPPVPSDEPAMVWLDGMNVELGPEAVGVLDELETRHLRGMSDTGVEIVVSDLRWVDDLDDSELDEIEHALDREVARRKKG